MTMDLFDTIQRNYIFRGLKDFQLTAIKNIVEQRVVDGGEQLVRQFEKNYDMMIVVEGSAKITSFSGEAIAEVGPGSVIGEMSLIDDQPRSATVTAVGKTLVAVLPYNALKQLIDDDRDLAAVITLNIAKVLAQRLRNSNMQLDSMLGKQ